jgi:hypothetical protein
MPRHAALWPALADMNIRYSPPQLFQMVPRLTTAEFVAALTFGWLDQPYKPNAFDAADYLSDAPLCCTLASTR